MPRVTASESTHPRSRALGERAVSSRNPRLLAVMLARLGLDMRGWTERTQVLRRARRGDPVAIAALARVHCRLILYASTNRP